MVSREKQSRHSDLKSEVGTPTEHKRVSEPIDFFKHLNELKDQLAQKDVFVFLDYDGTLTPIVATPDLAVLSEGMREAVRKLSSCAKVSIVSGRATDDVQSKVQIDGIFYAGSHGFEIVSPDGKIKINEEAQAIQQVIDVVYEKLNKSLKNVKDALVEHIKYTISVHYRLVSDDNFPKVKEVVEEILSEYPNLRMTNGKKVFELRPRIDWHKGKAVEWILNVLGYQPENHLAVYIGDDVTDEDAFAVLEDKGFGILVADTPRDSKATYMIRNTQDVKKVLEFLIQTK